MSKPKSPGYWTPERIKEKADCHKTLKDFFTLDVDAYSAAARLKILPEITALPPVILSIPSSTALSII